jgi:uncharacterized protein (DUF2062 family)
LPLRLLRNVRDEAREFRAAVASAPEPQLGWDVAGLRRLGHKLWWRLLHEHTEPGRMAAAVFIGAIIGTSPLFGFHLVLCLLAAMTFRLNKLVTWIAANVSLPIFAPFLGWLSSQVGHLMLHGRWGDVTVAQFRGWGPRQMLEFMGEFGWYWLLGFPFVGAALGALMAGLTWLVVTRRRKGA